MFQNFLKTSLVILLIIIVGITVFFYYGGNGELKTAVAIGLTIAYTNTLIGFAIISWGFKQSHNLFVLSIFGGIIFRFMLIFILLFILIWAFKIDRVALISTLVTTYFLFLGLEIFQIQKFIDVKRK